MHTGYSPDSETGLEDFVARCVKTGLDCIAVTDHNTMQGALKVQAMAPFQVIIGEEIKSAGGEIIGLFLQETIPRDLPPLETVNRIKEQGGSGVHTTPLRPLPPLRHHSGGAERGAALR